MESQYNPQELEHRIQRRWEDESTFKVTEDPSKEKFYCLSMLPYPSGKLHMGHVRNYTIGDVISRFQRMLGKNVLQPMGWDAFGLPAENAAIKNKVPPARWTYANIDHMRQQLKRLGYAYDWDREVTTCRPEYYRWEQQMFVRLFEQGLVYQKSAIVNWDPVDQTVLANEQVVDGRGWRSGALVERKEIPQWFIKITDYADELLDCIEDLSDWPESVKSMQQHWIGRSEGLEIRFEIEGEHDPVSVFTTRPDTLLGATYIAVAAEHPLATFAATSNPQLTSFIDECKQGATAEAEMETMEKRGMPTGIFAVHPVSGERVPVWVANFVLMGYGTGAVMSVPGHDQRDWEFATKYKLPIIQVIEATDGAAIDVSQAPYMQRGRLVNSGDLDGMDFDQAFASLEKRLSANKQVNYRIRDWGVSRQRYWGCPIPIIHCPSCGAVPVPENQLPVVLPEDVAFMGVNSPIKEDPQWRKTTCPKCGGPAERETDTFDTFVESSWYYARYCSPGAEGIVDERANYWLPVDHYIGGIEHAVMHLLYFRFWHKLLRDAGLLKSDEPAIRMLCQGMVVAETYFRGDTGEETWYSPDELELELDDKGKITGAKLIEDGLPVEVGRIEKMSKSKNNGVDPESMISLYGADTVRLFSMFAAPPDQQLNWSDTGVEGMSRFLKRLWRMVHEHLEAAPASVVLDVNALNSVQRDLRRHVYETLVKVKDDYERRYTYNTAIAAVMELVNELAKFEDQSDQGHAVAHEAWRLVTLMLNPIVPHICSGLWVALGEQDLEQQTWPQVDSSALIREQLNLVVQVNGKLRAKIEVSVDASEDEIVALAKADANVARFIEDKTIRKVIVVPGRLVNIVVSG